MRQKGNVLAIIYLVFSMIFVGCKENKRSFQKLSDHDLTILVMRMPDSSGDKSTNNYAARLIPVKGLIDEKDNVIKTRLWYNMDSCFYLEAGKKKIYASLIQPIANGVAGSFEYMLSFENDARDDGNWSFIYQDKYLNKKKYALRIDKE
jgi:hypothetical protein